jgi:large subunit ribosomal protein L4e
MELKIFNTNNESKGKVKLPKQFEEPVRQDIIEKVVLALQANKRQRYGAHPDAGKRASADLSRRRRDYRTGYGAGRSRVPRKILSRKGTRMNLVGAWAPGTVKGRKAHPPKAEKIWEQKINKKENRKAIRSALAATMHKELVEKRGHNIPKEYPFAVDAAFEDIDKTTNAYDTLIKLGFDKELERSAVKIIRAGKGKLRNRKYRRKKGLLIIVSKECKIEKAAANIPGIDVKKVNELCAEDLAPGTVPGRIALFTDKAIERMQKENIFM